MCDPFTAQSKILEHFSPDADAVVFHGSCLDFLKQIPDNTVQLIITSPPYNIGKAYEKRLNLSAYIDQQAEVVSECTRVLTESGSVCWQVGNYVDDGAIVPLDTLLFPIFVENGLMLRNRIVWHFEHGLHCSRRFSGRYETISWFTRDTKDFLFNLDPVRVPQKYPGKKHFKGPKAGQFSGNPLGKNPGDVWDIPNVKSNHVEKTSHPCQFPVELVERFVLSMTNPGDWILDPFLGTGTSIIAAVRHGRRGAGAETMKEYSDLSKERVHAAMTGSLRVRPMGKPKYDPQVAGNRLIQAPWTQPRRPELEQTQYRLLEPVAEYNT